MDLMYSWSLRSRNSGIYSIGEKTTEDYYCAPCLLSAHRMIVKYHRKDNSKKLSSGGDYRACQRGKFMYRLEDEVLKDCF